MSDLTALAGAYDQFGNALMLMRYHGKLDHRFDLAITLSRLGRVYEEMGNLPQAQQTLGRSASIFREFGFTSEEAAVQQSLQRIGS